MVCYAFLLNIHCQLHWTVQQIWFKVIHIKQIKSWLSALFISSINCHFRNDSYSWEYVSQIFNNASHSGASFLRAMLIPEVTLVRFPLCLIKCSFTEGKDLLNRNSLSPTLILMCGNSWFRFFNSSFIFKMKIHLDDKFKSLPLSPLCSVILLLVLETLIIVCQESHGQGK